MKRGSEYPPRLPLRFFRWFCHPDYAEDIEGDLLERFYNNTESPGRGKANIIFIRDVLKLCRPGIIRPFGGHYKLNHYGMFKNYLKVGMRNILKYKTFSFINLFGLAIAMAVGLLIILMLADQWSMDRFHAHRDRIYRVGTQMEGSSKMNASCPMPLAAEMSENYPFIQKATRLIRGVGGDLVAARNEQSAFAEVRGFYADPAFFEVFSFDLQAGEKESALSLPNSIIISSETAYKLFNDRDPIGKTVTFMQRGLDHINIHLGTETGQASENWGNYIVTGVIDLRRYNTHLKFDALISANSLPRLYQEGKAPDHSQDWQNHSHSYTYFLLNESADESQFQAVLDDLSADEERMTGRKLIAQRLDEVVLGDFVGNPISLHLPIEAYYFLGFLALVILVSAGFNYTNLSIARALTRTREIGVRKVNGATRKNLIVQFLIESILTCMLALLLANLLLFFIRPAFTGLWVISHLGFDLSGNLAVFLIFLAFAMVIGLFSGLYPALVLSRFSPSQVLKSSEGSGRRRTGFRATLNVAQFVFTFFFIVTSILITRQFRHFVRFDYGMNTSNVINIPLQGNDYELMMAELEKVPGVENVSACQMIPAMPNSHGRSIILPEDQYVRIEFQSIDPNLLETLDLKLIAGRNLTRGNSRTVIVNEYTAVALGYASAQELIGQPIQVTGVEEPFQIAGVFKDFKFQTPISGESDKPLVYWNHPADFSYLNVKIAGNMQQPLNALEQKWKAIDPMHPMSYSVYDESLAKANFWLGDLASVIGFIAFLAVVISCLGLLGMAIYNTERRVKEIGIRKVLGAKVSQLVLLLGRSFIRLLILSMIIGAPLSYFGNQLWIENIPNRIDLGFGTMLISGLFLMAIGLLTIGFQIVSVTRRNPVESLKYE